MNTSARKPSALRRVASDPVSRRRFLALTGGTTTAGALLAACGDGEGEGEATAASSDEEMAPQFGEGDLGIVNYALTLEYLEAAFYADVAKSGLFKGDDLALIEGIGQAEKEHVDELDGDREAARRPAGRGAQGRVPARRRQVGARARGDRGEPRRGRVPGAGRGDRGPGGPRRGALEQRSIRWRHATPRRSTPSSACRRRRTARSRRGPTCRPSSKNIQPFIT